MNRNEFNAFCNENEFAVEDAGRDWYDAGVAGRYSCAVIRDEEDFAKIKSLLDNDDIYLATAKQKDGQCFFECGCKLYANSADDISKAMTKDYISFLDSKSDIHHYSAQAISERDQALALAKVPKQANESEEEYERRIDEIMDGVISEWVTEPGYWSCDEELLFSDSEIKSGIWQYGSDNWIECVIMVLYED